MERKKNLSRRSFLKSLSVGTCGAVVHRAAGMLPGLIAFGAPGLASAQNSKVLLIVNLNGGASYGITPIFSGVYRDRNPTISYGPEQALPLSSEQGLHPALTNLNSFYQNRNLALINMVGYPNPTLSHAESQLVWFKGARVQNPEGGWAARLTCQIGSTFGGVAFSPTLPIVSGSCRPPLAIGSLFVADSTQSSYFFRGNEKEFIRQAIAQTNATTSALSTVKNNTEQLDLLIDRLTDPNGITLPNVEFPSTLFGQSCRDAARILARSDLGVQLIYLELGGFDTHRNERGTLNALLADLNGGLGALAQAAQALGRWQDLTIVTMSEFCRTIAENGSQGNDHGHAGPMLVMGGSVIGGIKTPVPEESILRTQPYLRDYHVDFRAVLSEIIRSMGQDADAIFPEAYQHSSVGLFA